MWRTRVGYAGGSRANPTYHALGDHTECFQVDFDPSVISYEQLLELFWDSHDPTAPAWRQQYASLVLAHDEEQLAVARASARAFEKRTGRTPATRIEPLDRFWPAEDYHQKYYLRQDRVLAAEFRAMFGDDETALRESTAAARVNGYVAGDGTRAQLADEIGRLGLSDQGESHLATRVGEVPAGSGCRLR